MKPPFSYLPAFPAALGWAAGILLWWHGLPPWGVAAVAVAGTLLMLFRKHYPAFGVYAVAAGWIIAQANCPSDAPAWAFDGRERMLIGTVESASLGPTSQSFVLRVDSMEACPGRIVAVEPFGLRVSSLPQWPGVEEGVRMRVVAVVGPLDPGGHFPHQADYSTLFLRSGAVAGAFIGEENMTVTGRERSLSAWFARRRADVDRALARSGLSDGAYGLLTALITGGDELDPQVRENFRASGVAHALALSGFHVGVVAMLVGLALFPLRLRRGLAPWRMGAAVAAVWFYAALAGMSESVVRASVMFSVYMLARMVGRGANPYNSLCVSVLVILSLWPYSLFSAGFQLSVCAVAGILAFSKALNPFVPADGWRFSSANAVAVPVAAVLGTMVLTSFYFHGLPLLFCIPNLVVALFLPLLMFGGLAIVVAEMAGWHFGRIEWMLDRAVEFLELVTDGIASAGAELAGVYLTVPMAVAFAVVVVALAVAVNVRSRAGWMALCVCAAVAVVAVPLCREDVPDNEAFTVGYKTNSPVLVRHGGRAVLVPRCRRRDVAGSVDRAMRELEDYLRARGVDSVVVTSSDFRLGPYRREGNVILRSQTQR